MIRAALATALLLATPLQAEIVSARYIDPTDRYPHAVLGDAIEHAGIEVTLSDGTVQRAIWEDIVFEDTEPRVIDLDGDGSAEVITVESHPQEGARLAIWGLTDSGVLAALAWTPFIGTRFRWLAPIGAADLDGDGAMEIAYIDRPHLAKTLRIWRYTRLEGGSRKLEQVAAQPGFTNHRIGEADIAGGIRNCGAGPEMIVASANWSKLLAVSISNGDFAVEGIGDDTTRPAFAKALACN